MNCCRRTGCAGQISMRLLIGLLIIGFGAILLASNLGLLDAHTPLRYFWPLAFVVLGVSLLIEPGRTRRNWGWVWIGVGFWIFADIQNWIRIDIWDVAFPALLLVLGARLVTRALRVQSGRNDKAQTNFTAFMSGHEARSVPSPFKEAEITAIMGGIKLDLTQAQLEGDTATLDVTVVMGGLEIYAPSDWIVTNQVLPLLGAAEDKRRPVAATTNKTLIVRGTVLMGGLEIKN